MWGEVDDRKAMLARAIEFTGNHVEYGANMRRVAEEWVFSCENALTDYAINRNAWLGHAACALAIGCPEWITREAWSHLSNEQQLLANAEAIGTIKQWEERYGESIGVHKDVEAQVLFQWDTRPGDAASDGFGQGAELQGDSNSDSKK